MNNPLTYSPNSPADFCGPARQVAEFCQRLVARGGTHRILFKGPPGTGKSALALWFCRLLAGPAGDFNIIHTNGTQVNVDAVDRFSEHVRYTAIGYRCILIDEADAIPTAAQTRMLTFLDYVKSAKTGIAVVATSNYDFDKFPERLQTRFKPLEVPGPRDADLAAFLQRFVPAGQFAPISVLVEQAKGNVRQALEDLDTALLVQPQSLAA